MAGNLESSLQELSPKERIYVQSRLAGMTQVASAAAGGWAHPKNKASSIEKRPHVQAAIVAACQDLAEEVQFGRKEAHEMLMSAYHNAATATEQVAAVRELINLHGIAAPKKVEHEHTHKGTVSLERMETEELMKLAEMDDLTLEGEYEVVTDEPDDQKALRDLSDDD